MNMNQTMIVLPKGTELHNGRRKYKVEEVLGTGGFGITYKVSSTVMVENVLANIFFAMKEYCVRFQYLCLPLMLLAVISFFSLNVSAQDLSVRSMEILSNDATASMEDFQRQDLNGNYAGVVKVMLAVNGATFEGGGVLEQRKHMDGEYWVWLAKDSKRIKIHAPGYLPLELNFFNDYKFMIESKRTYRLVLTFAKGEREQRQKLILRYAPADATVIIDDQVVEGTNGLYESSLPLGDHSYSIAKKGYGVDKGIFTLLSSNPKRLTVELEKLQDASLVVTETSARVPVTQTVQTVKQAAQPVQPAIVSSNQANASIRTFTANGVSFSMVYVEGGTFTMGGTKEQGSDAYFEEKPTHNVTLSSYYIGETEVTQALWEAVMGSNPSKFTGDTMRPVENVSWEDCQIFISKLNSLTDQQFKLPTEAQWEYAARGGNKSRGYKYSGSNTIGDVAQYKDNNGSSTHPVKTKFPNELGIYDMSGNVYEFCQDWYDDYSSNAQTDPTGPSSAYNRVRRGGCWNSDARSCRVSNRALRPPSDRDNRIGLRLAL